jgi:hypothetical protein
MRVGLALAVGVAAALSNAMPSRAALHPRLGPIGFLEADICGARSETLPARSVQKNERGDKARSARDWRDLASRCRSYARWLDPDQRGVILKLADEYDERAARLEARKA